MLDKVVGDLLAKTSNYVCSFVLDNSLKWRRIYE